MKKLIFTLVTVVISTFCFGQTDTIFSNNEKISCSVKEVTLDAVKYTYIDEEVVNSIYKNVIQKIVFKSGRVQTFAESTSFKTINGVDDYENVSISQVESEVKGLFKVGDVSSKAKGASTLSNQERVKERAYRKLKIGAALMGGNIVYLTNQRTEGNKMGNYFRPPSTAETNLTGIVYTNKLPNFEDFKKSIGETKNFTAVEEAKLWSNSSDMSKISIQSSFVLNSISSKNGLIIINGDLGGQTKGKTYRVVSFDNDYFNIYYETGSTAYNVKIKI